MNAQVDPVLIAHAQQAVRFLRVGLAIFSHRFLLTVAMLGAIGLSGWAMTDPNWMKVALVGLYLLLVHLPLAITGPKEAQHETD